MVYLLRLLGGIVLLILALIGAYFVENFIITLIFKALVLFLLIILIFTFFVFLWAYFYKLRFKIRIDFPKTPPLFSWINAPKKNASVEERTLKLANGKEYIIPVKFKGEFIFLEEWVVICDFEKNNEKDIYEVIIPPHSTTDLASIPWFIRWLISPLNNSVYAAVLHDYIYRKKIDSKNREISKKMADQFFYIGLKAKGVNSTLAAIMYLGVLCFGHESYNNNDLE